MFDSQGRYSYKTRLPDVLPTDCDLFARAHYGEYDNRKLTTGMKYYSTTYAVNIVTF